MLSLFHCLNLKFFFSQLYGTKLIRIQYGFEEAEDDLFLDLTSRVRSWLLIQLGP